MKKHYKFGILKAILAIGLITFILTSYSSALAKKDRKPETSTEETAVTVSEGDFIQGAVTWANTCGRCHGVRDPNEFTDVEWKTIVSRMRIRAGLTGKEARDVLKFLELSNKKEG